MKLPTCLYSDGTQLGYALQRLYDQVRTLTEKNIDVYNLNPAIVGDGLEISTSTINVPGKIVNTLGNTINNSYVRRKESSGLEFIVDASDTDEGRVCVLDKDYLTRQIISLIPEDPADGGDPGGEILTPRGALTLNTGGAFNIVFQRNDTTQLTLDGTNIISNDRNIIPVTTNTADIGTSSLGFKEIYTRTIDTDGAQTLTIQRNNTNHLTFNGTVNFSVNVGTDITPSATNTYNLGNISSGLAWGQVFARAINTDGAQTFLIRRNNVTQMEFDGTDIIAYRNFNPTTAVTYDLGSTTKNWRELNVQTIDTNGDLDLQVGNTTFINLDALTSNIISNDKHITATTTNTTDLGTSSIAWREVFTRSIDTDGANDLVIQRNNVTRITVTSADADFAGSVDTNTSFKVGGTQVVGEQGAAVSDASGGATIDAEARTAINTLLARVRAHGLIAT